MSDRSEWHGGGPGKFEPGDDEWREAQEELARLRSALERRERTVKKTRKTVRQLRNQIAAGVVKRGEPTGGDGLLRGALSECETSLEECERARVEAVVSLEVEHRACKQLEGQLEEAQGEISSETGRLVAHCPKVGEWLLQLDEWGEGELGWTERVVTTGCGPLTVHFLDEVLRGYGFGTDVCGSPDAEIMIVGHEASEGLVRQQIAARKRKKLRIYSQEMALLALLTGHDPFRAGSDVLLELGRAHPMLKKLMERAFRWPCIRGCKDLGIAWGEESLEETSPLTEMRYHVGMSSGLGAWERRRILRRAFMGELKFPRDYGPEQKREWGEPGTARRLKKMAYHIVSNISRVGSQAPIAAREWTVDLGWLKKAFYDGMMAFHWPGTNLA